MPGLLSLWPSSNGLERAGRGKQGLAAAVLGSAALKQAEGRAEEDAIPCSSPSPHSVRAVDVHASPGMRPGSGS